MLVVLALIDVVMISNLLIMVIVGGYETFVSRMDLEGHRDQPEWLSHVNASVLKVKLATAIIGISSIHLLKTFINADNYTDRVLIAQTVIHITFLLSAMAIAVHRPADVARVRRALKRARRASHLWAACGRHSFAAGQPRGWSRGDDFDFDHDRRPGSRRSDNGAMPRLTLQRKVFFALAVLLVALL